MSDSAMEWYAQLAKPSFAPPAWLFGPVWSVLYLIIALSFGYVFVQILRGRLPKIVALPFILNIIANALFSPLQFTLRSNALALVDILIVWATILWCMQTMWHRKRWVSWAQVPYLAWVSFASILQISITWLNGA